MLLYAHALLQIVTKKYHKGERTTSTANIKAKSSLLGYKTMPLAMLLDAHALIKITPKHYHKPKPTSSNTNIKANYSIVQ